MEQSGVYKITSPSGKIYIGQSLNVARRMIEHKYNSKSKNLKLYNSFREYGIKNHIVEIIFLSKDKEEMNKMESFYIKKFDTVENGLNHIDILNNIGSFSGKKHTEENVLKIKERMNGYKPTNAIEKRMKKVFCGFTNKFYDSISDCARDLNVSHTYISNQLNGKMTNKYNII